MAVAKAVSRGGGSSWREKLRDDFNTEFSAAAPGSPVTQDAYARLVDRTAATPAQGRARQAPLSEDQYAELWQNFKLGYETQYGGAPRDARNRLGAEPEWGPQSTTQAIRTRMDDLGLSSDINIAQTLNYAGSTDAQKGQLLDRLGIGKFEGIETGSPRAAALAELHEPRRASEPTQAKRQYQDITREQWDTMSDAQQKAVLHNTWLRRAETEDARLDGDSVDEEFLNQYHDSLTLSNRGNSNSAYRPNTAAFLETFGLSGEDNLAAAQRRDIGITASEISQLRNFDIQLDTRPSAQRTGDSDLSDAQRLVTNFEQRFQDLTGLGSGDPRGAQPKTQSELIRALDREFTRISSTFGSGARQESATDELGPLLGLGRTPDGGVDFRAELFDAIAGEGVPVDEGAITTLLAERGIAPEDFYNFAGQRIRAVQNSGGELPLGFTEGVWRDAEELKRLLNIREA